MWRFSLFFPRGAVAIRVKGHTGFEPRQCCYSNQTRPLTSWMSVVLSCHLLPRDPPEYKWGSLRINITILLFFFLLCFPGQSSPLVKIKLFFFQKFKVYQVFLRFIIILFFYYYKVHRQWQSMQLLATFKHLNKTKKKNPDTQTLANWTRLSVN